MKKKIVMVSLQFQLSNEVFLASFMSHRICDVSAIHEKFTFTFLCDSIIPSERKALTGITIFCLNVLICPGQGCEL